MDEIQQRRIQKIINEGYQFDLGGYLSLGFDLFKKNIGSHIGFTFLFFLILMIVILIPLLGIIGIFVLFPTLSVGWFLVAHKDHRNDQPEFRDFFKGFDHFGPLCAMFMIMMFSYILMMMPFMMYFANNIQDNLENLDVLYDGFFKGIPTWVYLVFIPFVYLAVSWRWAPMFIIFYKMGPWQAMETSRMIVGKNFWMVLLFFIITGLIAQMGQIFFFVGLLLSYPLAMCMEYAAFASITGLLEENTDIVDHLID